MLKEEGKSGEATGKSLIESLFEDPKYYDVEFIFPRENVRIKAIKSFLVANSEVWTSMFCGENWKDSGKYQAVVQIQMEDVDSEMFKVFLRYCYLREIALSEENILPVLLISETYMHKELIASCISFIKMRNREPHFLLQFLGRMEELKIELESITALRTAILSIIDEEPGKFLSQEGLFNTLSPAMKEIVFNMFSLKGKVPETLKLKRMIEYGEVLKRNTDTNLKEALAPVLSKMDPFLLCSEGIMLLMSHSLYSTEEVCQFTMAIMARDEINKYMQPVAYDRSNTQWSGSMLNPSTGCSLLINNGNTLIIELDKPQQVVALTFSLTTANENFFFRVMYSENGSNWANDSLHFPSIDTLVKQKGGYHKLEIQTSNKYKYWKLMSEQRTRTGYYSSTRATAFSILVME